MLNGGVKEKEEVGVNRSENLWLIFMEEEEHMAPWLKNIAFFIFIKV